MKKIVIIVLVVVFLFTAFIFGFKLLVTTIVNQRNCEFANIDNVEVNVGVNIPKIEVSQCNYDESLNLKSVYFKFKEQNSQDYITTFKFKKVKNLNDLEKDNLQYFLGNFSSLYKNLDSLYIKKGNRKNNSHVAVYNAYTNEFWAVIHFKD
ncbi:hypothetical protein [Flavobacterium sp.]|uniref:hypothetical protein n=1 Tax=Flavobacterium sp. TaxID=239 RepID=UPI003526F6A4